MTSLELPESVLPTPLSDGSFAPPERVFSVAQLDVDELRSLKGIVRQLLGGTQYPNEETWNVQTERMFHIMPWLKPWAERADDFLKQHGDLLTPPIHRDEGFSIKMFLNRASEDHMDIPRLWPAALSVGTMGTRELVGIVQPSPEATIELARRLIIDKTPLRTFEEIEGVPVERHIQQPGDVVVIGNFATLHSGYPLEKSVALAIASRNQQEGSDPQYIIDHYRRFYPGAM